MKKGIILIFALLIIIGCKKDPPFDERLLGNWISINYNPLDSSTWQCNTHQVFTNEMNGREHNPMWSGTNQFGEINDSIGFSGIDRFSSSNNRVNITDWNSSNLALKNSFYFSFSGDTLFLSTDHFQDTIFYGTFIKQ